MHVCLFNMWVRDQVKIIPVPSYLYGAWLWRGAGVRSFNSKYDHFYWSQDLQYTGTRTIGKFRSSAVSRAHLFCNVFVSLLFSIIFVEVYTVKKEKKLRFLDFCYFFYLICESILSLLKVNTYCFVWLTRGRARYNLAYGGDVYHLPCF